MPLDLGPPDLKLMRQRFHDQFGESMDPGTALDVIRKSREPDESDFWLCFGLIYPDTIYDLFRLNEELKKLNSRNGWHNSLLGTCIDHWKWSFKSLQRINWEGKSYNWDAKGDSILSGVSYIEQRWETLKPNLQKVSPLIPAIDKMITQMSELVVFLRSKTNLCQAKAKEAERLYEESGWPVQCLALIHIF
jgi:hypothetical protein